MKTGTRSVGAAKLRIRQCPALPPRLRKTTREVVSVETPRAEQGKGLATALMRKVCREADNAGLVLVLNPHPWGDNQNMNAQQLEDWYTRGFGFRVVQTTPMTLMARAVGSTPKAMKLTTITGTIIKEYTL